MESVSVVEFRKGVELDLLFVCKQSEGFLVTGLINYYLALISSVRFAANPNSPELLKKEILKSFALSYGNTDKN